MLVMFSVVEIWNNCIWRGPIVVLMCHVDGSTVLDL